MNFTASSQVCRSSLTDGLQRLSMPPRSPGICSALPVMKCEPGTQNAHPLPCAIHCRNGHIRTSECISSLEPRIRSRHSSQATDIDPNRSRAVIHMLEDRPRRTRTTQGAFSHGRHRPHSLLFSHGEHRQHRFSLSVLSVLSVARVVRGSCCPWHNLRACAHTLSALRPS